jgi:hypothetical protein
MTTTLTAPRLTTDAEIETLAYAAGLAGTPISSVWARVCISKQSDASAYWNQGNRDRRRDAVPAPEMDAESRMIAGVTQHLEDVGFEDVAISKNWNFSRYGYGVMVSDTARGDVRVVVAKSKNADLCDVAKLVYAWVRDDQSRVRVSQLFQPQAA